MLNIQPITNDIRLRLARRRDESGMWRGMLSSSAISTSVSIFALHLIDSDAHRDAIERGTQWLLQTMSAEGTWGDSVESPPNMTATLLSYTSLHALGRAPQQSRAYLASAFGGSDDRHIIDGVLRYYDADLTFSVPILSMCALSGVISSWSSIPPFPFELAMLPQRLFRFLNIPVVSYAIPALIAIGILQLRKRHSRRHPASILREPFVRATLKRLTSLQPQDGGFLEAAPLTAFVAMCLGAAGYPHHIVTKRAAYFLVRTQRDDGSWPIDTDLAAWTTSLAVAALGDEVEGKDSLAALIKSNATRQRHPFNGAAPGGWGWTDLSGSVPDGDDTPAALIALHTLGSPCDDTVCHGIEWIVGLQNHDGGMPTFCKGWGRLPFDRSAPDISAHCALAIGLWLPSLPHPLRRKAEKCLDHILSWLERNQSDGSWTPLWFGDQDAPDEKAPVYGTATLMFYLCRIGSPRAKAIAEKGLSYLLNAQNADGGWGGQKGVASKVAFTAKAIAALSFFPTREAREARERALSFICRRYEEGTLFDREPIGLYFARLWYSEEMYPLCFLLAALKTFDK